MKTVYIAGPITGVKNYEFAFMKEEQKLKNLGFNVFNPVKLSKTLQSLNPWKELSHEEYMNYLLPYLLQADEISMLEGWEESEGARLEHDVAVATGKTFLEAKSLHPRWGN